MRKWLPITLLLFWIIPLVSAVDFQYSANNATWEDVTNVNSALNQSYQINLHACTTYYFRGRFDDLQEWKYTTQQTECDVPMTALASILGIAFIAGLFLYFAFRLEQEHFILKLLLVVFSIFTITLIPTSLANGYTTITGSLLKITMWFLRLFVIYFAVYIFYDWAIKSERYLGWLGKSK